MKLVYKILLAVVLPLTIISAFFFFFIHNQLYKEVEHRFFNSIKRSTSDYANLLDIRLSNVAQQVYFSAQRIEDNSISGKDQFFNLTKDNIAYDSIIFGSSVFLNATYSDFQHSTFLYAFRENGEIKTIELVSGNNDYNTYFGEEKDWLIIPKKTGKGVWTSPYYDEGAGNKLMITYSQPIFIQDNFMGVVTVDIKLADIKKLLLVNEKSIEGDFDPDLYIINTSDSLIIFSEKEETIGDLIFDVTNKQNYSGQASSSVLDSLFTLKPGSGLLVGESGESTFFTSYEPVKSTNWTVLNALSNSKAQNFVYKVIGQAFMVIIIFVIIIIIIIFITGKIITSPISKLSSITLEISKGNYNKEININRNDEIGTLANNFKHMAYELDKREKALKQSNISLEKANTQLRGLDDATHALLQLLSHEIRTPLNGIMGSTYFLEEMISDPELSEFIDMLKESVERLDHFSKLALDITQLQTFGNDLELKDVTINKLIHNAKNQLDDVAKAKNVSIEVEGNPRIQFLANTNVIEKSFYELIKNGIQHSKENQTISIKVLENDDEINISFTNRGDVIPPDKIEQIKLPFGLTKGHYDKSTGLGLAYVQACLNAHKGFMKIKSNEKATTFTLCFKAK